MTWTEKTHLWTNVDTKSKCLGFLVYIFCVSLIWKWSEKPIGIHSWIQMIIESNPKLSHFSYWRTTPELFSWRRIFIKSTWRSTVYTWKLLFRILVLRIFSTESNVSFRPRSDPFIVVTCVFDYFVMVWQCFYKSNDRLPLYNVWSKIEHFFGRVGLSDSVRGTSRGEGGWRKWLTINWPPN